MAGDPRRPPGTPGGAPAGADFWTNYACMPHSYLYESFGVRRGVWTVGWLRDLLGEEAVAGARAAGRSVEDHLNAEAAKVPPGCDGLMTVLDWLAPTDAPYRKGTILGFDGRQGRFHMYRSILEALALSVHATGTHMATELGTTYRHTVVSGGGSGSDLMMQIHADVFGVPAHRAEVNNAAGLGSAICAAVGLGAYRTFDEAIDAMVRPGAEFTQVGSPSLPAFLDPWNSAGSLTPGPRSAADSLRLRT
ncbi:FGGY-family carbohydrate kinase [Streptomyces sp. NPDC059262]|uniref:FGGY-family carbohydrate kinase n=1 Tax=Streptomyces sp. NPDC059262 TaxID=3346797 RepID=UPI00368F4B73